MISFRRYRDRQKVQTL